MNRSIYFHPLHDSSSGSSSGGANGRDVRLESLASQLDALGAHHVREATERGMANRVFQASVAQIGSDTGVRTGVLARIGWQRWAGVAAAAAVVGLAVMIPLGVFSGNESRSDVIVASAPAQLSPAGISELMLVGLFDDNAALESIDMSSGDGIAPVAMTRGHRAEQVQREIQGLLALGGGR